jgi:hypothetical protein
MCLLWMKNARLVNHTADAIAMTSLFPFQMAMLVVPMSDCLGNIVVSPQTQKKTYMRSTIKSEAARSARYPKSYKKKSTKVHSLDWTIGRPHLQIERRSEPGDRGMSGRRYIRCG